MHVALDPSVSTPQQPQEGTIASQVQVLTGDMPQHGGRCGPNPSIATRASAARGLTGRHSIGSVMPPRAGNSMLSPSWRLLGWPVTMRIKGCGSRRVSNCPSR